MTYCDHKCLPKEKLTTAQISSLVVIELSARTFALGLLSDTCTLCFGAVNPKAVKIVSSRMKWREAYEALADLQRQAKAIKGES